MARWEPDAQGRLQLAALELFQERGYAAVTVAEIADRAGLTKRTFFNHFSDKREVLFAGAKDYEAGILTYLAETGDDLSPLDAVLAALARSSDDLAQYAGFARARQRLIESSIELRERDLVKTASLTAALADALNARGVPLGRARLTAQAALAVFDIAYVAWIGEGTDDLGTLMGRALEELREAVA
jgi:AcrR family transcriptional regulator